MKNLIFIFFIILSTNLLADGHVKPEEGAFTTLNVAAKDVDKYVNFLRNNSSAFKAIGSSDAGVCITRSGNDYPGELMVWNAFPSIEAAMVGTLNYDPYKATGEITKLRELKHSATWKSLKSFKLEPGHEWVARVKVKQKNINAFVETMAKVEKEVQANGHPNFFNGVFISIGGGFEAQTLMVRNITNSASDHGKIIDEYFEGKYPSFNSAMELAEGFVSEQIQVCEQIYFSK
ncbi:MAG: hypothetical protein VYB67_02425 [Pseudomonadota bacterium]|nr:hypothetical protein [Pseudomonadota bacterium]MEC9414265.1 hypothetical protein [Pseudomonadota bacterium]MEC9458794.1 hypothetical protein [Pseudomonadota bacterium]